MGKKAPILDCWWTSVMHEEVNPRSFTYVRCDLVCWQALSAYFCTHFISSHFLSSPLRDYLDYSGKTSEENQEPGRKNCCHMTESVALS